MKQFKKIIVLVSVSILCINLQAQNLSESETVEYIQKTLDNYKIYYVEGDDFIGLQEAQNMTIKYHNPIVTIGAISFNVNDVTFTAGKLKKNDYWEQLIIDGTANIRYRGIYTSRMRFCMREQIVATRLKNAFEHLQKISGKGKSAPDPFDDVASSSTIASTSNPNQKNNDMAKSPSFKTFTYRGQGAFSISYPANWEITETPYEMVKVSILAPLTDGNNFRTNVNVVSSKKSDSVEKIFQVEQDVISRNRQIFNNYKLISKEEVSINGIRGLKVTATWSNSGVNVKGIQYILKKADNTTYTITFTIIHAIYEREVENIIQSFRTQPNGSTTQQETAVKQNPMEDMIIKTIKAYQNKDERTLNQYILKDFGVIILYQPTFYYRIHILDRISNRIRFSYLDYDFFETTISINDHKISYGKLPEFDCGKEKWNKPSGIYCDTINIYRPLSDAVRDDIELEVGDNWPTHYVKKFKEIERGSFKVIVIGKQKWDYLIFYVTFIENKWYLTIIENADFCSA